MSTIHLPVPDPFVVGRDGDRRVCRTKYRRLVEFLERNPQRAVSVLPRLYRGASRRKPKVA